VIAEGVASEEQLGILRRMGCDQYQGFFRSPAVPAAEIEGFARHDERPKAPGEPDIDRTQSKLFRLCEA
jgi:diguanylate cyclase